MENDAWKEAANKAKWSSPTCPVLRLIPEASANADGTHPEVLERLCHGATGLAWP